MVDPETAQAAIAIPWETAASIVAPLVGAGVVVVRWMMARLDKNASSLEDAILSLRKAVDAAAERGNADEAARATMVQAQQRITFTQERILAILESELRIIDRDRVKHGEEAIGIGHGRREGVG